MRTHYFNAMGLVLGSSATACVTHHHVTAGPTTSVVNSTHGAEMTGELTAGGDAGLMTIVGATARAGHDISGVALRVGLGVEKSPATPRRVFAEDPEPSTRWSPLGVRGGVTIGPTFYDDNGTSAHFEARGALAVVWSFARAPAHGGEERRVTLGLELFASTIALRDPDVLLGIGITVGAWQYGSLGIAASRPPD